MDNSTGFLLEATAVTTPNPEYTAEKRREADRKEQQARREREKQAKALPGKKTISNKPATRSWTSYPAGWRQNYPVFSSRPPLNY